MSILYKTAMGFFLATLITGHLPSLSPHWRAVADDLHQAEPQAKVKAMAKDMLRPLFHGGKG